MSKVLMKNNEPYFIDCVYDLHQVVDDDTYDVIVELIEDEKEIQCGRCDLVHPEDVEDYEDEYEDCKATLTKTYDLLEEIKDNKFDDSSINEKIKDIMRDIKWDLR